MNYSDYDSDGYSSNEDADYVPSDENLSEDDINECEKEDPLPEDGSNAPHPHNVNKKQKKSSDIRIRKRKKRVLKVDVKEEDGAEEAEPPQEEVGNPTDEEHDDEARQKKKSDDLWASFLSDVGSRPKHSTTSSKSSTRQEVESSVLKAAPLSTETKASESAKVTITKVFDFAGEEVRVNKEVSADSREAKSYLKAQNAKTEENGDNEKTSSASQATLPGPSAKRPAGMSSILGRIGGKKQKMSTLEKSKMDWDAFKSEEGITEELAIHNRGREGYVERKNFLERVDHRQFELEKAVRLSNMKQ
ncbi:craniofacial development protein 1 [Acanthochromis polyacanthus]|uniref:Craniofacial development protein 1 n=1 Tax=Acanthochromis polyacanthus TaxID=80966 RepID=A0A3Q1G2W0_9TELE|nr:craniofacial development protein 1 [Acanthochromis polyacanthus]